MGEIISEVVHYERKRLVFDDHDRSLQVQRRSLRQDYEAGKHVSPYMKKFCKRLVPCPECGKTPEISIIRRFDDDTFQSIKLSCEKLHTSKILIECGDWHETLAKAGRSWNARARGNTERIDGKLHRIGHWRATHGKAENHI